MYSGSRNALTGLAGNYTAAHEACVADIARSLKLQAFAQSETFDNVQVPSQQGSMYLHAHIHIYIYIYIHIYIYVEVLISKPEQKHV